jgi:hypothetical protein
LLASRPKADRRAAGQLDQIIDPARSDSHAAAALKAEQPAKTFADFRFDETGLARLSHFCCN